MTTSIHPTAIISSKALLGKDVSIGPFTTIGPDVEVGDFTKIHSHVSVEGHTRIGHSNEFFKGSSIGGAPQDLSYKGECTRLEIGHSNIFREYTTVHRGTMKERGITKIGSHSFFMAYVHFGHDVEIGDHCLIANTVNFAGHVKVGDKVVMGGGCNVSQFVHIGRGCYIGGGTVVVKDVPAFCTGYGNRMTLKGINIIGLKKIGYSRKMISEVVTFLKEMELSTYSSAIFIKNKELMKDYMKNIIITEISENIQKSQMGIVPFA